ncbi:MAG: asparaginase [Pseudomonadota bacterium]
MAHETPILVEVTRGGMVESHHRGSIVVVDSRGNVKLALGDVERLIYPRSAIKPIQSALVMAESGAAQAFDVSDEELALACASHDGETVHVVAVREWLLRLGLSVTDLECGTHDPYDVDAMHDLYRAQGSAGPEHNNCSGKHTGLLTICRHKDVAPTGYLDIDHPAQAEVCATKAAMCDVDLANANIAIDGCGVPTIAMPLHALALGMARLADPSGLSDARADACRAVVRAIADHPVMVAGTKRFCTALLRAGRGRFVSKTGAEGVYCAAWPEHGLGVAIKIDDGDAEGRARAITIAHVLRQLGALDDQGWQTLKGLGQSTLRNWAGTGVGALRPTEALSELGLS